MTGQVLHLNDDEEEEEEEQEEVWAPSSQLFCVTHSSCTVKNTFQSEEKQMRLLFYHAHLSAQMCVCESARVCVFARLCFCTICSVDVNYKETILYTPKWHLVEKCCGFFLSRCFSLRNLRHINLRKTFFFCATGHWENNEEWSVSKLKESNGLNVPSQSKIFFISSLTDVSLLYIPSTELIWAAI